MNSVNSYDSLSSRRYQELVNKWSISGARTYGRYFEFLDIELALADPAFPFSNIEVILSKRSLKTDRLKLAAEVNGIKLYETITTPIELLQTPRFKYSNGGEATIDPPAGTANLPSRRVEMLNDFQKIEVTASPGGNSFVPKSAISSRLAGHLRQRSLRTVTVNGFYQGVIVPPNTGEIELFFRQFVLWSWLPQLLFTASGALLLLRSLLQMGRRQRGVRLSSAGGSQPT